MGVTKVWGSTGVAAWTALIPYGYAQAMALTWDEEGEELATEEVKVSMAFRVEVMLDEQHMPAEEAFKCE